MYVTGGGLVQRVATFQTPGFTFDTPPTEAELSARWAEIDDLSNAVVGVDPRS